MSQRIAVLGATGLVGTRLIEIASRNGVAPECLGLFASAASAGQEIEYQGSTLVVEDLMHCDFSAYSAALFCIGDHLSAEFVPQAVAAGCQVVDKSNAFRMSPDVPLVVAGVNDDAISNSTRLAANPNCTTIVLCHAIAPLAAEFGIDKLWLATYQSVSGAGRQAVTQLIDEIAASLGEMTAKPDSPGRADTAFFNVVPGIGGIAEDGHCSEESKLINETRKILNTPDLQVIAHAVRVPVTVGHAIAVTAELNRPVELTELAEMWNACPDILFVSDRLPSPASAAHHDQVEVGRLRHETGNGRVISFFACGDNINIAAALNGWRIHELLAAQAASAAELQDQL